MTFLCISSTLKPFYLVNKFFAKNQHHSGTVLLDGLCFGEVIRPYPGSLLSLHDFLVVTKRSVIPGLGYSVLRSHKESLHRLYRCGCTGRSTWSCRDMMLLIFFESRVEEVLLSFFIVH